MGKKHVQCLIALNLFGASGLAINRPQLCAAAGPAVIPSAAQSPVPIDLQLSDEGPLAERIEEARNTPIDASTGLPVGLDHEIARAAAQGKVSVIVHLDPTLDTQAVAGVDSPVRKGIKDVVTRLGARVKYEYEVVPHALNIRELPKSALAGLNRLPGVVKVEEDEYGIYVSLHDSVPLIHGMQNQISSAGLAADGTGVRVCIVDTGIDSDHIMFSSRIDTAAGWDFANGDSNPEDDNGHGSHCAGIALGRTGLTVDLGCGPQPFQGVAPNATLIGVKVLNSFGGGFSSDIVAGINRCASPTLPGGQADVISLSLGTGSFTSTCDTHTWAIAVNNAVNAGVVVTVATGNECLANSTRSPACASKAIAVGATWDDAFPNCEDPTSSFNWSCCVDSGIVADKLACFSNRASFIDVTAPGVMIYSASIAAGGTSIVANAGTSMACPHVAGLAALILDVNPSLTPAQVKSIIESGAVDLGAPGFDSSFGWGRIDVLHSLQLVAPSCTSDTQCDDGLYCNGVETCVNGNCQAGTPPNCSDAVACTTDTCIEATDACTHVANNAACNDGLFCNGVETCNATLGCQAGTNPCGAQLCNESTDTCGAGTQVWISFLDPATVVPGIGTVANEDIVSYDMGAGTWSFVFDGSDVGLATVTLDGIALLPDGSILMSFRDPASVPGLTGGPTGTSVDDSDIVRFIPTSLGANTAGSFVFYFDGSDVGLTSDAEDIDAIGINAAGQLVLSTRGAFNVPGASGSGEDLFTFTPTSLGSVTAGTFSMLFDGSDVGLNGTAENIDAAAFRSSGSILLSTSGNFSVTGASGANEDIVQFTPTTLGPNTTGTFSLFLDLSTLGISTAADVTALEVID